jgi:hypothetical protein
MLGATFILSVEENLPSASIAASSPKYQYIAVSSTYSLTHFHPEHGIHVAQEKQQETGKVLRG